MVPQEKIRRSPGRALGRCVEQGPHSAVSLRGAVLISHGVRQPARFYPFGRAGLRDATLSHRGQSGEKRLRGRVGNQDAERQFRLTGAVLAPVTRRPFGRIQIDAAAPSPQRPAISLSWKSTTRPNPSSSSLRASSGISAVRSFPWAIVHARCNQIT
jgi:hypothetical protein